MTRKKIYVAFSVGKDNIFRTCLIIHRVSLSNYYFRLFVKGGFVYLASEGDTKILKSPDIGRFKDRWGCLRFWYYSGGFDTTVRRQLSLYLVETKSQDAQATLLWSTLNKTGGAWKFIQVPLHNIGGVTAQVYNLY